jgi:Beta-galactosidase
MIHQAVKSLALTVLSVCCLTAVYAQTPVPYLQKQGTATQLIVEGKPFIILGGELGNSTASSLKDMERVYAKLKGMHLNTVLVPVYWELMEPEEGRFDFSLVDGAIDLARKHELKMVFLWFGAFA